MDTMEDWKAYEPILPLLMDTMEDWNAYEPTLPLLMDTMEDWKAYEPTLPLLMDTMEDWKAYELQSVRHHQETYRQTTWRQEVIPEHVYFESGYIHNWNKHRLGRIVKRRKHWITQHPKNGKKTPSYSSKDPEMKRAGQWQSSMRQNYKKKILPSERIVALNATQGWKWDDDPFQDNLDNWITQYHRNGDKMPSQHSKDLEMKRAGKWQSRTHQHYKNTIEKKEGTTLPNERITALNATEGWKWSGR